jgi:predicted membrane-bound mannosyltransferase/DNA-binding beta-propeller fold protein YncE
MTEISREMIAESQSEDLLSRPIAALVKFDWEKGLYLIFIIAAIIIRFWSLGDRVVSHDESLHTQYSFQYYNGDGYQHTPLMHGPSLFHLTAVSFWLFGDNDFSARIPVAIVGILLVIAPYFLRDWIGRKGALIASFLLLVSPYFTYYSRYIRHDIYVIAAAVLTFTAILYYLRQRKDKYIWWFALGLALMFTTMETSFIYVAIFGGFLVIRLLLKGLVAPWFRPALPSLARPLLIVGLAILLVGAGFVGQRLAHRIVGDDIVQTPTPTEEGFAIDPTEVLSVPETAGSGLESAMRWLQVGGLFLLAGGLFMAARSIRTQLDEYPEFDLIVLFTTLVLPSVTAFLVVLLGRDPLQYTINKCELEGQATMSAWALFTTRLGNEVCRDAFLSSSMVFTGIFLIIMLTVSILVGLWWHKRRWLIAAAIFHSIFLLLFTSFFSNPTGWLSGTIGSLGYWLAQQEVKRANQPGFFYFIVLPLYEFLPLTFTLAAAVFWSWKHRLSKILGYWLGAIGLALLTYSLTNWLFNRNLFPGEEGSNIASLLLAGGILLAANLYWFLTRRQKIRDAYDLGRSWRGLISMDDLVGLIPYLLWWFVMTWVIYGWAGEKMAWLSLHYIFPMVLMSGWYINAKLDSGNLAELISRRFLLLIGLVLVFLVALGLALAPILLGKVNLGDQEASNLTGLGRLIGSFLVAGLLFYAVRRTGRTLGPGTVHRGWMLAIFALLSLLTIRTTYMAAFPNADYVTEFMVYAHGAPATKSQVLSQLEDLSVRLNGDKSIKVAFDNDSSWPYTWYLRDYPNRIYFGDSPGRNITEAPVIIVGSQNWSKVEPLLGDDYDTHTYTFLWWPMEEYRKLSWNAVLGDPIVAAEDRRGLGNPDVRQALWDIFFYRDYQKYGEVFGGSYTAGQWPLRHDLRMYIRKDALASLWDHGLAAIAAEPPVDPYAENELSLTPNLVIGGTGSGDGQLLQPRNLALGPDGLIYVADSGNHRIQVFDSNGQFIRGWGAFGSEPGLLNEPWGIAVDDDYVYVADTWNHRLQKFTLNGGFVAVLGASGSPVAGDLGGGLFFGPRDIVILADGNLLITDTGNHRLQILDPEGIFVRAFGTQGSQPGQFYEPVGIDLNSDGYLYLADTWNGRIQQFTTDLFPANEWPVDAWSGESINNKPYLAVDGASRVYITDPEGYRVIVFDQFGQYLARFGRFGTGLDTFGLPNGIKIDAAGNIYVADAGNNHILRFAPIFEEPAPAQSEDELPAGDQGDVPVDDAPADDALPDEALTPEEELVPSPTQ